MVVMVMVAVAARSASLMPPSCYLLFLSLSLPSFPVSLPHTSHHLKSLSSSRTMHFTFPHEGISFNDLFFFVHFILGYFSYLPRSLHLHPSTGSSSSLALNSFMNPFLFLLSYRPPCLQVSAAPYSWLPPPVQDPPGSLGPYGSSNKVLT